HGAARGWLGRLQGACGPGRALLFQGDRVTEPMLTDSQLRALVSGADTLTYTCVPPGSGPRVALDRDEDGGFDRDELDAGTDPANALSIPPPPGGPPAMSVAARRLAIRDNANDDERRRTVVIVSDDPGISFPPPGSAHDPRCNGDPSGRVKVSLTLSSASSGQVHRTDLPCQNWTLIGTPTFPLGYRYRDREVDDGTVRSALWKEGKVALVAQGTGPFFLSYDLVPGVSQNVVDGVLASGAGNICLSCSPESGRDGSDGREFRATSCAAPAACGLR
ncbi:MAG: hypothetical protein U0802_24330, partial [Candidatus Binatia bacterium]